MVARRELAQLLADVPMFARCSKRDLAIVTRHTETTRLDAEIEMVTEGDVGDAFFILLEGSAVVTIAGRTIRHLGVGDYFGELALIDPAPRSATVTTTSPVLVGVLGARIFRTLLRELPALSQHLLGALAAWVRDVSRDGPPL